MFSGVDLSSDTVTKPSAAMKAAMLAAELGDEQRDEDPTTRELELRCAELLGLADSVFMPSATMANEIAIMLHTHSGDELIAAENCHLFFAESGAPAVLARVMCKPIKTTTGIFTPEDLASVYYQSSSPHRPKPTLLSIENTTNLGGGIPWSREQLNEIVKSADKLKLRKHMDGARLFNASIATNMTPVEIASSFDTVTLCFSKGLGCPIGAALAFNNRELRSKVKYFKHLLGGGMRQSGIIAAAGIYALKNNVARLIDDHENATILAGGLSDLNQILVVNEPMTNIVIFEWIGDEMSADQFYDNCIHNKLRFSRISQTHFRAVTHFDITRENILEAIDIVRNICRGNEAHLSAKL